MSTIIATAEAVNNGEIYATNITVHQHTFLSDELPEIGGKDEGPAPGDYLCAALASCKVITLRMYANRKGWKVDAIKIKVNLVKGDTLPSGNNTFFCEITFTGELDEEQSKRLHEISKACPIQRLLAKPSEIVTVVM